MTLGINAEIKPGTAAEGEIKGADSKDPVENISLSETLDPAAQRKFDDYVPIFDVPKPEKIFISDDNGKLIQVSTNEACTRMGFDSWHSSVLVYKKDLPKKRGIIKPAGKIINKDELDRIISQSAETLKKVYFEKMENSELKINCGYGIRAMKKLGLTDIFLIGGVFKFRDSKDKVVINDYQFIVYPSTSFSCAIEPFNATRIFQHAPIPMRYIDAGNPSAHKELTAEDIALTGPEKMATINLYGENIVYDGWPFKIFRPYYTVCKGEPLLADYGTEWWAYRNKMFCVFTTNASIIDPNLVTFKRIQLYISSKDFSWIPMMALKSLELLRIPFNGNEFLVFETKEILDDLIKTKCFFVKNVKPKFVCFDDYSAAALIRPPDNKNTISDIHTEILLKLCQKTGLNWQHHSQKNTFYSIATADSASIKEDTINAIMEYLQSEKIAVRKGKILNTEGFKPIIIITEATTPDLKNKIERIPSFIEQQKTIGYLKFAKLITQLPPPKTDNISFVDLNTTSSSSSTVAEAGTKVAPTPRFAPF